MQLGRLGLPVVPGESRAAFRSNARALLEADIPTYISTARITQMLPSVHRLLISEPIMKFAAEPTFVEHGYPTPYSYAYRKDLMFENSPTDEDIETVFPAAQVFRHAA